VNSRFIIIGAVLRRIRRKCASLNIKGSVHSRLKGAAAREWLARARGRVAAGTLYQIVFTLPVRIADIAYQNKAAIYDPLFKDSSETLLTIAAVSNHLGARIGELSVLILGLRAHPPSPRAPEAPTSN
jgi:hypothetical protein